MDLPALSVHLRHWAQALPAGATLPLTMLVAAVPFTAMLVATAALARRWTLADTLKRGARILHGRQVRRQVRRRRRQLRGGAQLSLAGVPLAASEETRHFKLIGTTGTGKSTAIAGLLARALARGDRAVITDPDGGYRRLFFDRRRGDIVLNPFDPLSVKWDPFAEISKPWDVDLLSSGVIPTTEDASGREWRGYARTFLTAIARRCHDSGWRDSRELWRLITVAPSSELRPLVAGSPAQPFLEPENARMFGSIRSVAASAAAALEYVQAQRARMFSVREWVRSGRGVLFLPYGAAQIAALRSIIATWVRLAIFEAMEREREEGGENRALWFVVDELDSLGAIDGLKDALARLRKFGGRCVLGFQSSCAGVLDLWGRRGTDDHRKLREHLNPPLLGERARRHLPVRGASHRGARGAAATYRARPRPNARLSNARCAPLDECERAADHRGRGAACGTRAASRSQRVPEDRGLARMAARARSARDLSDGDFPPADQSGVAQRGPASDCGRRIPRGRTAA
jgi:Type IV secretion-system coupling protein DNA-binding domain